MPHKAFAPTQDPWDVEHAQFLQLHPNAIAHSDKFYTGVVHKGFDADATAEELIRKYPPFEETAQHRKFLVRSISERFILPGERDDYFTPEQLWEEDDRINGKRSFTGRNEKDDSDEESVVEEMSEPTANVQAAEPVVMRAVPRGTIGEEQLESDEQLAKLLRDPVLPKGREVEVSPSNPPSKKNSDDVEMTDDDLAELFGEQPEQPTIVVTTPEAEVASAKDDETTVEPISNSDLLVMFRASDHTTTITRDQADVQRVLHSLNLSHEEPPTSIIHTSVNGSLVLALLGHVEADASAVSAGNDANHPVKIDESATTNTNLNKQQVPVKKVAHDNQWNIITQRPHRSTVAFLSGSGTCSALLAEICWDPASIVATSVAYDDGRILILLVGEQSDQEPSGYITHTGRLDSAEQFVRFFDAVKRDQNIPAEHSELASLLQIARNDMIEAGTLDASYLSNDDTDGSDDEHDVAIPQRGKRRTSVNIAALKRQAMRLEKRLDRAREAVQYTTTRSNSFSPQRMQDIIQKPKADYVNFSHVDDRQKRKLSLQENENHPPTDEQSSRSQVSRKHISGFPANFGSNLSAEAKVSTAANPNSPPTNKRKRGTSSVGKTDADEDGSDEDNDDGNIIIDNEDDDEGYVSRPQRKRRTASKSSSKLEGKTNKLKIKVGARPSTLFGKKKKRQARKNTTASASASVISDIRGRLARFKVKGSSTGGSVASSQADGEEDDSQNNGEELSAVEENDDEESEED